MTSSKGDKELFDEVHLNVGEYAYKVYIVGANPDKFSRGRGFRTLNIKIQ